MVEKVEMTLLNFAQSVNLQLTIIKSGFVVNHN